MTLRDYDYQSRLDQLRTAFREKRATAPEGQTVKPKETYDELAEDLTIAYSEGSIAGGQELADIIEAEVGKSLKLRRELKIAAEEYDKGTITDSEMKSWIVSSIKESRKANATKLLPTHQRKY
ncbi:MAG: hypothetical protein D4S01_02545 [Dehalococcoidia bacterium]|nr:MAG: hypothetical protein D4S01_02545 [Dehalococcoidia bacterium]